MRVFDNSCFDRTAIETRIPQLSQKLSNKTLAQLEREGIFVFPEGVQDAEDLTGDQMVLQRVNNTYYTGNIMGFLGCGQERLVISSRFSRDRHDFFLQYMLDKVQVCPNVFDLETNANEANQLIDILIFLFPSYLKAALRKGLFKNYTHVKYNDSNPKGSINISRHIRKNTPFVGNIAYDQREHSLDNYISQLIRHTIEYIKTKQNSKMVLAKAKAEINRIVEATPRYKLQDRQKVLNENKKHIVRHAYFREYRALQRLCILILQHQKQELSSGITQVYGVLFDGAWLWEEYINCLVSDIFYHPMNKASKDVQWLFTGERRVTGKIYPDFIGKDNYKNLIADAKYKPLANIQGRDYLQVLAYMFRFDATTGIYFYPEAQAEDDLLLKLNRGSSFTQVTPREDICLVKYGLKISQAAENYQDFRAQMSRAEEKFKSGLLALI